MCDGIYPLPFIAAGSCAPKEMTNHWFWRWLTVGLIVAVQRSYWSWRDLPLRSSYLLRTKLQDPTQLRIDPATQITTSSFVAMAMPAIAANDLPRRIGEEHYTAIAKSCVMGAEATTSSTAWPPG
jgi:hypothetical protein